MFRFPSERINIGVNEYAGTTNPDVVRLYEGATEKWDSTILLPEKP